MSKNTLSESIKQCREFGTRNFSRLSQRTNIDKGAQMIILWTTTTSTKVVGNWGRERDHDVYIGLNENGWIRYSHDVEHLCGPTEISNEQTKVLSDSDIIDFLNNCSADERAEFITRANKIMV